MLLQKLIDVILQRQIREVLTGEAKKALQILYRDRLARSSRVFHCFSDRNGMNKQEPRYLFRAAKAVDNVSVYQVL